LARCALRAARSTASSTTRKSSWIARRCVVSSTIRQHSSITRRNCRNMRLRLRLAKQEAEATRRREGLLVGGEQLQQLELLQRREARSLLHRPLGSRGNFHITVELKFLHARRAPKTRELRDNTRRTHAFHPNYPKRPPAHHGPAWSDSGSSEMHTRRTHANKGWTYSRAHDRLAPQRL